MSKKQTIHYFQERKGWLVLKNFYDELNPSVVMEITHTIFYFYFVTWALMNFYFLLHFFFFWEEKLQQGTVVSWTCVQLGRQNHQWSQKQQLKRQGIEVCVINNRF